jgi:hypothetical protein
MCLCFSWLVELLVSVTPSCFDYICHLYFSISRDFNESCLGIELHPTASSVSKVTLYAFGRTTHYVCLGNVRLLLA